MHPWMKPSYSQKGKDQKKPNSSETQIKKDKTKGSYSCDLMEKKDEPKESYFLQTRRSVMKQ